MVWCVITLKRFQRQTFYDCFPWQAAYYICLTGKNTFWSKNVLTSSSTMFFLPQQDENGLCKSNHLHDKIFYISTFPHQFTEQTPKDMMQTQPRPVIRLLKGCYVVKLVHFKDKISTPPQKIPLVLLLPTLTPRTVCLACNVWLGLHCNDTLHIDGVCVQASSITTVKHWVNSS